MLNISVKKKLSSDELSSISSYLFLLISSGISIDRSLDIMAEQAENKRLRRSLRNIKRDIERGSMIYKAWEKEREVFPEFFVKMIEIGEKSGNMENIYDELSRYYSDKRRNDKQIKTAMIYPAILAAVTALVFIAIMVLVMPNFVSIFEDMDVELPLISRIVIEISIFFSANIITLSAVLIISVLIGLRVYNIPNVKLKINSLILRLPGAGGTVININSAFMTKVMYILFSSGIGLSDSVELTMRSMENPVFKRSLKDLNRKINSGMSLHDSMRRTDCFPPVIKTVLRVGEETGNVEESLFLLSKFFEEELSNSLKRLIGLVEPVMIIIISLLVILVVITVLLPMMNMYSAAGL